MREVSDELRLGEVGFDSFLHLPVDVLDLVVGSDCIHSTEALGNVHHVTGIEECDLFLPPFLAVLGAKVLSAVLSECLEKYLHLEVSHFFNALDSDVHECTLLLNADDLLDKRSGLSLVVKTHNGGLELLEKLTACVEGICHVVEEESTELSGLGLLVDSHLSLCHNAESTLGTDKYLVEVGTCSVLGSGRSLDDITVWKNNLHLEYHVVDLTVLGRRNADTSVSEESADCGAGNGRRIVHCSITLFISSPLNVLVDSTCAALYVHALLVYVIDLVHSLCVKNDTSANGNSTTLSSAACAPCGNGDLVIVSYLEDGRNFFCILGSNNEITLGHAETSVCPHSGEPEIVNAVGDLVNGSCRTVFSSDCILKLGCNHIK